MKNLLKELKSMMEYVNKYQELVDEMKIEVRFVKDLFEEETYVEVILKEEGEEVERFTVVYDGLTSNAKAYTKAKNIEAALIAEKMPAEFVRHVYN